MSHTILHHPLWIFLCHTTGIEREGSDLPNTLEGSEGSRHGGRMRLGIRPDLFATRAPQPLTHKGGFHGVYCDHPS
jgi:hypothetical protein